MMMTKQEFLDVAIRQDGNYFDNSENHVRLVSLKNDMLLRNGKTEYKILLPEKPTERENFAAEELKSFFFEATGIALGVVSDERADLKEKYISLGKTLLFDRSDAICPTEKYAPQGYIIKTYDKNLILCGAEDYGTLYAVYDLLSDILGYDYLNPGTYSLNKNVSDIPLKHYDISEIPDIAVFQKNYGSFSKVKNAAHALQRLRMTEREETIMKIRGTVSVHNMMTFLPPETHYEKHPLWYSEYKQNGKAENLCLTAHGNKEEYAAMVKEVAEVIKSEFRAGSKGTVAFFGQSDGAPACDCEVCKANKQKYGEDTGSCILFLSDVLDDIYSWFKTEDGKKYERDFYIAILAYLAFEFAPIKFDEATKKFKVAEGLRIHDKLGFISAPIKYDYGALSTAEKNVPYYRNILAWGATMNKSLFYTYDFNTRYYFCPVETLVSKQELYRLMAGLKCIFLYDMGQWMNEGLATGFSMMKLYVSDKLRWNVNIDVDECVRKYFKGVYGELYEDMYSLYRSFRDYWVKVRGKTDRGECNPRHVNYSGALIGEHELWDYDVLAEWRARYDEILKKAERFKDKENYELLYRNIILERVSVTYILLLNYSNRFSTEELHFMRMQFKEDCELNGLTYLKEGYENWDGRHRLVQEVLDDWKI
ncbi:MAG: DUF4838 domain-containing protein [Clostridia bacterium]|nr:DUF4838 domain-containing protein [Clostridia bacterium]